MKGLSCCCDLSNILKAKLHFIGHEFVVNFYKVAICIYIGMQNTNKRLQLCTITYM